MGSERGSGRWEIPDGSYAERQVDGVCVFRFVFVFVSVCVCVSLLFVFVSVKLGKDVDNVGVGKFLRRLHRGQVDVGGGRAERKVASWVSAPPVRAVGLYYRAVREVYAR